MKSFKSFIPDKYNTQMELKKLNRVNYFTKKLLELGSLGFSVEGLIRCANITAVVENLIVWNKSLITYREGDAVYV